MKTVVMVVMVLAGLAIAQVCHQHPSIECPFPTDPNVGRIISWMKIESENEYKSEIRACDPDGHPVVITALSMPDGAVWDVNEWTWTPTKEQADQTHYFIMQATDIPDPNQSPKSDVAVYAVRVIKYNHAPALLPFGVDF